MSDILVAFCNPMSEQIVEVENGFVEMAGLELSASNLLTPEKFRNLELMIHAAGYIPGEVIAGGSVSNEGAGLGSLGHKVRFVGSVGDDSLGDFLENEMLEVYGVEPFIVRTDAPTCSIYTLNEPGKRTFAVNLGAAGGVTTENLPLQALDGADYLLVSGYKVMDSPETTAKLIQSARNLKMRIILDLSCGKHIKEGKKHFKSILNEGVYILFANEEETEALLGVKLGSPRYHYKEAALEYTNYANVVALKLGSEGAIVTDGSQIVDVNAIPVLNPKVNGAGDAFAVGFLHTLLKKCDLFEATYRARYFASEILKIPGARMNYHAAERSFWKSYRR